MFVSNSNFSREIDCEKYPVLSPYSWETYILDEVRTCATFLKFEQIFHGIDNWIDIIIIGVMIHSYYLAHDLIIKKDCVFFLNWYWLISKCSMLTCKDMNTLLLKIKATFVYRSLIVTKWLYENTYASQTKPQKKI